jgi:hypothetical protein
MARSTMVLSLFALACSSAQEAPARERTANTEAPQENAPAAEQESTPAAEQDSAPAVREAARSDRAEEPSYAPGVPQYPSARFLCSQHITGTPGHISWSGYATADPIETVRRFYESRFYTPATQGAPSTIERNGEALHMRIGPDRTVSIHPAGTGHPTCDVAHAPSDRVYIVVSTMALPAN